MRLLKNRVVICAVIAAVLVPLGLMHEGEPLVEGTVVRKPTQWELNGTVTFPQRAGISLWGELDCLAERKASFQLFLPNDGSPMTPEIYKPLAIQAVNNTPLHWEINYPACGLAWFCLFVPLVGISLLFNRVFQSTPKSLVWHQVPIRRSC
jgi:hypothetical protein